MPSSATLGLERWQCPCLYNKLLPRGSFPRGHLAIFRKCLVAMAHERVVTGIREAEAKATTPQWPLGTEHHPGQ